MRFPNAYSGVKKIFVAQILMIIGAIPAIIALIFAIATIGIGEAALAEGASDAAAAGTLAALGLTAIFGLIAGILMVIAYIFEAVGVIKAMKDEPAFKISLFFIFVVIACVILNAIPSLPEKVGSIASVVQSLAQLCISLFIIQGVRNLADRLNNGEMSAKGQRLFFLIAAMYLIIFIADVIAIFAAGIAEFLQIAAGALDIFISIAFIVYLSQAKKMLAR